MHAYFFMCGFHSQRCFFGKELFVFDVLVYLQGKKLHVDMKLSRDDMMNWRERIQKNTIIKRKENKM